MSSELIARFRAEGRHPKKALGQNFLRDPRLCRAIAELAAPAGGTVLEIGPGLGALTGPLLERGARVVALERDAELVRLLADAFAPEIAAGALALREADATEVDWAEALAGAPGPLALAGNLPYSVTGLLLRRATAAAPAVERAVFMVQREVADRMAAAPGTKTYGALTVFVQAAFAVERAFVARPGAFWPAPAIDSAVVRLTPLRPPRAAETPAFALAVSRAFGQRRKTLRNAWRGIYGWGDEALAEACRAAGIELEARGETLPVEAFAALARQAPAT
ncbi:MAG TPA: 16S rRNA (adenine(1518)-N(6)/adenine(1519)-N(6))-dimethyltransferase RsmA [Polyangiaceae bacterium]|nr:16S rRNA (adenine(1518)-N(6)/adenine(1519)-N(6))-dimethyltransferase RsmA [Polyangiaceae bacterium]